MKLSRETEYGLMGLVHLAQQPEGTVMRPAEIFQKLTQYGLVRSLRGTARGYTLNKPADEISFREVLELREGAGLFERCVFWKHRCAEENPRISTRDGDRPPPG